MLVISLARDETFIDSAYLVLFRIAFVRLQCDLKEAVLAGVLESLLKVLVAGAGDVAERGRMAAEMVIDAMALHVVRQSAERAQEGQVLSWILVRTRA